MPSLTPPRIAIVTPSLADANNGNWRTAHRWHSLLSSKFQVIVHNAWRPEEGQTTDLLIALHARRSAAVIRQFRDRHPGKPLILVLTGTDLYRALAVNEEAGHSLELADALIVLQDDAIQYVPSVYRRKTHVVYQSAKPLKAAAKKKSRLDCVVVGHLRAEKSPETIFRLVRLLSAGLPIRILHIGAGLDASLAAEARELSLTGSHYHWAGAMPHGLTRAAIKRAHILIHPSMLEGGANVIVEAITSGTPVLASHMSGNIGMLGHDYQGYFPVGDERILAQLLRRCLEDQNFQRRLITACAARAKLFLPETERESLCLIVQSLLDA